MFGSAHQRAFGGHEGLIKCVRGVKYAIVMHGKAWLKMSACKSLPGLMDGAPSILMATSTLGSGEADFCCVLLGSKPAGMIYGVKAWLSHCHYSDIKE